VPDIPDAQHLHAQLLEGLCSLDVSLSPPRQELLVAFVLLIAKWNRVYNLTAVREPSAMIERHVLDSLSLLRWLPASPIRLDTSRAPIPDNVFDVIDVGSGAGLPVLPLAIARPDLTFLSVEANGKKTRFQTQAMVELALGNVQVVQQRAEAMSALAQSVTSRAFAAPEQFLQVAGPLCLAGGQALVMLGRAERMPQELPGGFAGADVQRITAGLQTAARHVAVCHKL